MNIYQQLKELYNKLLILKTKYDSNDKNEIDIIEKQIKEIELLLYNINYYKMNDIRIVLLRFISIYKNMACHITKRNGIYCIKDCDNLIKFYLVPKKRNRKYCDIYNFININNSNVNFIYEFIDYLYDMRINNNLINISKEQLDYYLNEYLTNNKTK